jgi:hypothetical protein
MARELELITEDVGGDLMVIMWQVHKVGTGSGGIAADHRILIGDVPVDFYTNFFDYAFDPAGPTLTKIGTPLNNTQVRPIDNNDYPLSILRANSHQIFKVL